MMKRIISLILAVVMMLSLNVVAFADPDGGIVPEPVSAPIECPENDQSQDDDCDQNQQ
ncbi:MAG: hypothetical protein FWC77_04425 [Defluviitaleaceae bacterium]|nr:hypothetical protein [Defluviitaleaceae bacterium]